MSRYRHEIDSTRAHITSLWAVIALLSAALAYAMNGLANAPRDLTFHVPPDLSSGASVRAGDIPKPNVYAFAFYMWQQINRWPENGAEDFPAAIYSFAAYLTPRFQADLLRDLEKRGKQGELLARARAMFQAPASGYEDRRVDILAEGVWVVWIDTVIEETVNGLPVKDISIRYPLRVVAYDVDREANPWGMALDGFADPGPYKIELGEGL